jgi:hypothetical protein
MNIKQSMVLLQIPGPMWALRNSLWFIPQASPSDMRLVRVQHVFVTEKKHVASRDAMAIQDDVYIYIYLYLDLYHIYIFFKLHETNYDDKTSQGFLEFG